MNNCKRPRITYEQANAALEGPTTYAEAIDGFGSRHWKEAIRAELASLSKKGTWKLVSRPPGKNIIGCKWVFSIKRNEHGEILRYKARLVAQGFRQVSVVDFKDTHSPVASMNSTRLLLAINCRLKFKKELNMV